MTTTTAPAGWYADPAARHELRWWDGGAWSAYVSDRGQVATEQPLPTRPVASTASATPPAGNGHAAETRSEHAVSLIDEAVATIEANVTLNADGSIVAFTGSESPLMGAADKLGEASRLVPEDAGLRFAWISALAAAAQWKDARERLQQLVSDRPDFVLARLAAEGVEKWTPMFLLPPWTGTTVDPHPRLRTFVKGRVLTATRERITPRATFFMRDVGNDFNAEAVRSARIDLATVVSSIATAPQVVALYLRIWDDPANPYRIETIGVPFTPRGSGDRAAFEYLCVQSDLDVVILDPSNGVRLNRRVRIPDGMRAANQRLLDMLLAADGAEIAGQTALEAVHRHTSAYDLDAVPFEEAVPLR